MPDSDENHSMQGSMATTMSRAVSLLAAIACLTIARFFTDSAVFHLALAVVVLPLGFIWYGREIGGLVGAATDGESNAGRLVGALIAISGWVALGAMLAVVVLLGDRP